MLIQAQACHQHDSSPSGFDDHLFERKFSTLSGGERRRVGLAKLLIDELDLILLDEPTRGVDASARQDIYRILSEAAAKGASVLFATSEFSEALLLSQRIVVMRQGTIAADFANAPGLTPEDIMRHSVS